MALWDATLMCSPPCLSLVIGAGTTIIIHPHHPQNPSTDWKELLGHEFHATTS